MAETERLEAEMAEVCGVINAATGRLVDLIARVLDAGSWQGAGIRSPEQWVAWRCGVSPGRARSLVPMARRLGELPRTNWWSEGTAPNARLFPGVGPRFHTGLPPVHQRGRDVPARGPGNVARWGRPDDTQPVPCHAGDGQAGREVVTLGCDPVLVDSTGAPCLLYRDHKGRRDDIVPISDVATAAIRDQQRIVALESPGSPWLFPRPGSNADHSRHFTPTCPASG